MSTRILLFIVIGLFASPLSFAEKSTPYDSSSFTTFDGIKKMEQLKVAFDFNFSDPRGIKRALHPISILLKTIQEYGPVSFEPLDAYVVSHGSEVVAFARQNYKEYKDIVDRAARLSELGVKFEVCSVAAAALGYEPNDFHGFISVVPTGTYALVYHQNQGYALMAGAGTVPSDLINPNNRSFLGENLTFK